MGMDIIPPSANQALSTTSTVTFAGVAATSGFSGPAYSLSGNMMQAATMTYTNGGNMDNVIHRFDWTNAMVVALGAVLSAPMTIFSTPATGKTIVKNIWIVITTPSAGTTTMTVSCGRVGATYIDCVTAGNAQAAANTMYGVTAATRGANNNGFDIPSWTASTTYSALFTSTVQNLSAQTAGAGSIFVETLIVPY